MQIGELYKTKDYRWLLFSNLQDAQTYVADNIQASFATTNAGVSLAYLKKVLQNSVTVIEKNSIVVPLEESKCLTYDKLFVKMLTTNGEVGWIILSFYNKTRISKK